MMHSISCLLNVVNRFSLSKVLQLPFALIPTIAFSSSKAIMGEFANGRTSRTLALFISVFVILTNVVFTGKIIMDAQLEKDHFIAIGEFKAFKISLETPDFFNFISLFDLIVAVGAGAYIAFNIYLIVHMCCAMGCRRLARCCLVKHLVLVKKDWM